MHAYGRDRLQWEKERAKLEKQLQLQQNLAEQADGRVRRLKQQLAEDRELVLKGVKRQFEEDTLSERRKEVEQRRALERTNKEEKERLNNRIRILEELEADRSKMLQRVQTESKQRVSLATQKVRELEEQAEDVAKQHLKELSTQRQLMDRQRTEEKLAIRQAPKARKENERRSYGDYRNVYDEVHKALAPLAKEMVNIENAHFAVAKLLAKQTSYPALMEKHDPWFKHKYPKVREQLDILADKSRNDAVETGQAIGHMRIERLRLQEALRQSAHISRALTLYTRYEHGPSKAEMVRRLQWIANIVPFATYSYDIDQEIKALDISINRQTNKPPSTHQAKQLEELRTMRYTINRIIHVHAKVRDVEALKALLTDTLEEKEVFLAALSQTEDLSEAARILNSTGDIDPNSDNEGGFEKQRAARRQHFDMNRELMSESKNFKQLVRKRSLLQQSLNQVPQNRVLELDTKIKELISLRRVETRFAFARIGLARASSFVRAKPATQPKSSSNVPTTAPASSSKESDPSLLKGSILTDAYLHARERWVKEQNTETKKTLEREVLACRQRLQLRELEVTKRKKAALLQGGRPDRSLLQKLDAQIDALQRVASRPIRRIHFERKIRLGRRRYPEVMMKESDEPLKEEVKQSDETTTKPLNIQPTAPLQTARLHLSQGSRRSYSTGNKVSGLAASSMLHTRPLHDPDSVYLSTGALHVEPVGADAPATAAVDATTIMQTAGSANPGSEASDGVPSEDSTASIAHQTPGAAKPDVDFSYRITPADYRNAVMASRNSSAAFWSYKLYQNHEGDRPKVHFCTTLKQAEEQAQKFIDEPVLGFDIEWEPYRKATLKDNVSLIQIAAGGKIGIFHLARFFGDTVEQLMPPSLRQILQSENTIKAGVNVAGDATRLRNHLNVDMRGLFELSHLYKVVHYSATQPHLINKRMMSLAEQVQKVLLLPLKKDDVRTSAWAKQLNSQQMEYSASDAYAGFQLFHALEAKRTAMDPVPPRPAFYERHEPLVLGDGTIAGPKAKLSSARKAHDADEDGEEEFYDALETQTPNELQSDAVAAGVPLAGPSISYPTLPSLNTDSQMGPEAKTSMPQDRESAEAGMTATKGPKSGSPDFSDNNESKAPVASADTTRPRARRTVPASSEVKKAD
ncbi:hypothetical protein B0A50_04859 [Salinomyces thailandicus]|uniref:3'-5' exonuclease domain-containing protein n=1 Tax=Salinomyces thailandicus TaxID=706561 RepID=A0A4U0TZ43_9PEZI|nr:hypothetical protein B0A50_04859 [Salinomyces thailandica]